MIEICRSREYVTDWTFSYSTTHVHKTTNISSCDFDYVVPSITYTTKHVKCDYDI